MLSNNETGPWRNRPWLFGNVTARLRFGYITLKAVERFSVWHRQLAPPICTGLKALLGIEPIAPLEVQLCIQERFVVFCMTSGQTLLQPTKRNWENGLKGAGLNVQFGKKRKNLLAGLLWDRFQGFQTNI